MKQKNLSTSESATNTIESLSATALNVTGIFLEMQYDMSLMPDVRRP